MNELQEQFLDMCLEEVLGDQSPPDLSEKILFEVMRESRGPADDEDLRASRGAESERLVEALTPSGSGPGAKPPTWARPGRLPSRWRRTRRLAGAVLGLAAVAAFGVHLKLQHDGEATLELAQVRRANVIDEARRELEQVRAQLARAEESLIARRLPEALEAAHQAQEALDALPPEALSDPVVGSTLESKRSQLRTHALLVQCRGTALRAERDSFAKAGDLLERAAQVAGEDDAQKAQVLVVRGDLALLCGQTDNALEHFEAALALVSTDWRARLGRGRVAALQGRFDDATHDFTRALDGLEGDVPGAARYRAMVLAERSDAFRQREELERALLDARLSREIVAGFAWRGWIAEARALQANGDWFPARDAFAKAIRLSMAEGSLAYAEALLDEGLYDQALAAASRAGSADPRELAALVLQARAHLHNASFGEAEDLADQILLRATGALDWKVRAQGLVVLAELDMIEGQPGSAMKRIREAADLAPYDLRVRLVQAQIQVDPYFEGQYLEGAMRVAKTLLRRYPRSATAKRLLGQALFQMYRSQPERAQRKLEDALDVDPHDPATSAHLGHVFHARSQRAGTRKAVYQQAAERSWQRANRYDRDARREASWAYARGLRAELAARGVRLRQRAEYHMEASKAYRLAAWLNPMHAQARLGLARIAHDQGSSKRTLDQLNQALYRLPKTFPAEVLRLDVRSSDPRWRQHDQARALLERLSADGGGSSRRVKLLSARVDALAGKPTTTHLAAVTQRYDALRKADPLDPDVDSEELLVLSVLLGRISDKDQRRPFLDRLHEVKELTIDRKDDRDQRDAETLRLIAKAQGELARDRALPAMTHADRAARLDPRNGAAWLALAQARESAGSMTDALRAYARAAALDDAHLAAFMSAFERSTGAPLEFLGDPDQGQGATDAETQILLDALPRVHQVFTTGIPLEEAKQLFSTLEKAIERDPTRLLPHALVGLLSVGVNRNEYAIQSLLFLATVRDDQGVAAYFAAVAAARSKGNPSRFQSLAIRCLLRARRAGYDWSSGGAPFYGDLQRLQASPIWKHAFGR